MSMQNKPQMVEAVLFFNERGICKEMHYPEFEALLDNVVQMHDFADQQVRCAFVLINPRLLVRAVVFFYLDFDEHGAADKGWNLPLRKLAEQSGSVAHITILTPKKALDTTNGSGEAPANKNNDQLVNAVKTWEQTGKTGKGVNIAVVDTGLDYTHADFGGAGTTEAYQTALQWHRHQQAFADAQEQDAGVSDAGWTFSRSIST